MQIKSMDSIKSSYFFVDEQLSKETNRCWSYALL